MKRIKAALAALGVAATLAVGACGHSQPEYIQSYDVVCDQHEYLIHDYHCGYVDHGHWVYFGWAHPGVVSRAPVSWKPPKSVRSKYQTTRVANPKYHAPKQRAPKVSNPNNRVTNQNKSVQRTTPRSVKTNPGYRAPISNRKTR